jgi:hypothetical protein
VERFVAGETDHEPGSPADEQWSAEQVALFERLREDWMRRRRRRRMVVAGITGAVLIAGSSAAWYVSHLQAGDAETAPVTRTVSQAEAEPASQVSIEATPAEAKRPAESPEDTKTDAVVDEAGRATAAKLVAPRARSSERPRRTRGTPAAVSDTPAASDVAKVVEPRAAGDPAPNADGGAAIDWLLKGAPSRP